MSRISEEVPQLLLPVAFDGESSASYATRVIRDAIVSGILEPGSEIPQGALAEQLGVSRIPVRDGLRQLESEGLVRIPVNRPARVAQLDIDEFLEVYDLREMIEPYAVNKSASRLTSQVLERIETLADMFDQRAHSEEEILRIDREFHMLTMSAAPYQRVQRLVVELQNASQHFRRTYSLLARDDARGPISADHHALVEALRRQDGEGAAVIARRHLQRTRGSLEPLLRRMK